jgi:predicted GNAT superfamily acetyltransferase
MLDKHEIGELVVRTIAWTHYWHMIGIVTDVKYNSSRKKFHHKVEWITSKRKVDNANWGFDELTPIKEISDANR